MINATLKRRHTEKSKKMSTLFYHKNNQDHFTVINFLQMNNMTQQLPEAM